MKALKLCIATILLFLSGWCSAEELAAPNTLFRGYSHEVKLPVEAVEHPATATSSAIESVKIAPNVPQPISVKEKPSPSAEEQIDWNSHQAADALIPICGLPITLDYYLNCFVDNLHIEKLVLVAKNSEGECGIEKVGLLFDYFGRIDLLGARRLIVPLVSGLADTINANKNLCKYFATFPITVDQIVIRIRVRPPHCGFVYPVLGNVVLITAIDSTVSYGTLNSFNYEIDNLRTETYLQAQNFVFAGD